MDMLAYAEQVIAIGLLYDVVLIVVWCRRKGVTFNTVASEIFKAIAKICAAIRNFVSS